MITQKFTERELVQQQPKQLFKLSNFLKSYPNDIDIIADLIPGLLHINSRKDLGLEYMSKTGCDIIKYEVEELHLYGAEIFVEHSDAFTLNYAFPKVINFGKECLCFQIHTFIQGWMLNKNDDYYSHFLTNTKLLDAERFLSLSQSPSTLSQSFQRLHKVFEPYDFLDKNFQKINSLTKREVQILKLIVKGDTQKQVGEQLFISHLTVKTHCRNIFRKLNTKRFNNLIKYVEAFNLIED